MCAFIPCLCDVVRLQLPDEMTEWFPPSHQYHGLMNTLATSFLQVMRVWRSDKTFSH
jgi:hypothetical protein